MKIGRPKRGREGRSSRRRDLRLESLEGRAMLSPSRLANQPPAEIQSATRFVPMKGTIGGVATLDLEKSTTDPTTRDVSVPVTSTGSGNLSHLGKVTLYETHHTVILFSSGYMKSQVSDGGATITAANGDQLDLTFTGMGDLTANGFNDKFLYTITGGTGRFAGARGGGNIDSTDEPHTSPIQVPFLLDLEGVIATVGSSKP